MITTIEGACPVCKGDVKGSEEYKYLCEKCNLLFDRNDLILSEKYVDKLIKKEVAKKYDKIEIEQEKRPEKETKKLYYVGSKTSNIVHLSNCPFAKNIKSGNKIKYKTEDEIKNLKKCRCIL